jgi:hypothetical protein
MSWPLVVTLLAASPPQHALSVNGSLSGTDAHGALAYSLRTAAGWQLGAEVRLAAPRESFISGYPASGGVAPSGLLHGVAPLVDAGPLQLSLALQLGVRALFAADSVGPDTRALVLLTRLGPIASVRVTDAFAVRAGWCSVVNLQLTPGADLEALGQVLMLGAVVHFTPSLAAYADFETGGLLGFGGDGGKYLVRGSLGLRWTLNGGAPWSTF